MKNLNTLLLILFAFSVFAQTNKKIDYNKLLISEYQLSGIQNKGQADIVVSKIMEDDNCYFCSIDYENNKCFTLSSKKEDINLNFRGVELSLIKSNLYSENMFFNIYVGNNDGHSKVNKNELPKYVHTGNTFKDDLNYYRIKQIFNKIK